ncbi:DUF2283 domain-containing protein [Streptosporangium sp. NPDC051022]|uniref:DUF2283 domain-containing protein n=1 Tax=Streptosporangium sp. NPDC051022 TaxID=3155752 RepID=UPI00341F0821
MIALRVLRERLSHPDGGVARMMPVNAMVNLDLDADGRVVGIEIPTTWPQTPAVLGEDR